MNRDRRKIFGTMLVDAFKYIITIIVIGSIFAETIKIKQMFIGLAIAGFVAFIAYKLIPPDKKED